MHSFGPRCQILGYNSGGLVAQIPTLQRCGGEPASHSTASTSHLIQAPSPQRTGGKKREHGTYFPLHVRRDIPDLQLAAPAQKKKKSGQCKITQGNKSHKSFIFGLKWSRFLQATFTFEGEKIKHLSLTGSTQ